MKINKVTSKFGDMSWWKFIISSPLKSCHGIYWKQTFLFFRPFFNNVTWVSRVSENVISSFFCIVPKICSLFFGVLCFFDEMETLAHRIFRIAQKSKCDELDAIYKKRFVQWILAPDHVQDYCQVRAKRIFILPERPLATEPSSYLSSSRNPYCMNIQFLPYEKAAM